MAKLQFTPRLAFRLLASIIVLSFFTFLLGGCKVDEKKEGETKNVNISSPFGDLKVRNQADARDTGLSVYPGAREKKSDNEDDKKSANVNMSFGNFGLKVVVVTYESDDAPDKVLSYYRNEMKKFGSILECKGGKLGGATIEAGDDNQLKCDGHGDTNVTELKVGKKDLQHVVAVKPNGKGSEFSLVYVRAGGGEDKGEPI